MAPDAQVEAASASSSPYSQHPPSLDANPALRSWPSWPPLLNPATSSTLKFAGVTASKYAADAAPRGDLEDPSNRKEDQSKGVVPNTRVDEHMGQAMEQAMEQAMCSLQTRFSGGGEADISPASHPQLDGKVTPLVTETAWEVYPQPKHSLSKNASQAWGHTSAGTLERPERPVPLYTGMVHAYPITPSMAGRGTIKDHLTFPNPDVELCTLGDTGTSPLGRTSRGYFSTEPEEDIVAETPAEATFQTDGNAVGDERQRVPSRPLPWSSEEASQLRRVVKRVIRRGIREKELLWLEVSREHGNGRGPRECKLQYTRDYKSHKASVGAGSAPESRPQQSRRVGSSSRGRGRLLCSEAPQSAHTAV